MLIKTIISFLISNSLVTTWDVLRVTLKETNFNKQSNPTAELDKTQRLLYSKVDSYELSTHKIAQYTIAIKINPKSPDVYVGRSTVYQRKAYIMLTWDSNKAKELIHKIAQYTIAIKKNPKDALAYKNRGDAYRYLEQYDEALADYNQALKINPNYDRVYNNRGIIYSELEQYDKALADFNKSIKINPNLAYYAYNNRGSLYTDFGQYDKAFADFNKSIKINPKSPDVYVGRSTVYQRKAHTMLTSDSDKAKELYRKAIVDLEEAKKILIQQGETTEAEEIQEEIERIKRCYCSS